MDNYKIVKSITTNFVDTDKRPYTFMIEKGKNYAVQQYLRSSVIASFAKTSALIYWLIYAILKTKTILN